MLAGRTSQRVHNEQAGQSLLEGNRVTACNGYSVRCAGSAQRERPVINFSIFEATSDMKIVEVVR